jgi:flagellar basal-body rod protein FlgB
MPTALDNYLGIHPQALSLEARRNEVLAANLANVDTPNYKARDVDFKAALAAAGQASGTPALTPANPALSAVPMSGAVPTSGASAVGGAGGALDPSSLKYRIPMAPSLDGNTVDEQLEQSAFAENSVRYQATLTFLNSALRDLMTAITGS